MANQSPSSSSLSPRQKNIISGLTAGVVTTAINHPLDLIKVRLQLDSSVLSPLQSLRNVLRQLYSKDPSSRSGTFGRTFTNVYRGLSINLVGNAVAWSLYFTLYDDLKNVIHVTHSPNHQHYNYLVCSLLTGSLTAFLTNPIWVLKTRLLSTNKNVPNAYKSIGQGVASIWRTEGLSGFFKGFTPSLIQVCQGALHFTIYDSLKAYHAKQQQQQQHHHHHHHSNTQHKNDKLSFWEYLYIASASKIISTTVFYPFQLFKARLQAYGFNKPEQAASTKGHFRSVIAQTFANEGIGGFYKGLYVNLLRALPATCVTFITYEHVRNYL